MEKDARDRVVEEFRSGTTKILIATDVLARGFDVTQVCAERPPPQQHVIHARNCDLLTLFSVWHPLSHAMQFPHVRGCETHTSEYTACAWGR